MTTPPLRPQEDDLAAGKSLDELNVTSAASPGAEQQSFWEKLWQPNLSPEDATKFWAESLYRESPAHLKEKESEGIAKAEPATASLAALERGTSESLGRLTAAQTSAGSILTMGAGGIAETLPYVKYLTPLLKTTGRAVGAWFGLQGLKQAHTGIQQMKQGNFSPDVWESTLLGLSAATGEVASGTAGVRDFLGHMLVDSFGLDPDMAQEVTRRVEKLRAARLERDDTLERNERVKEQALGTVDTLTKRRVGSLRGEEERGLSDIDKANREKVQALQDQLEKDLQQVRGTAEGKFKGIDELARQGIEASKNRIPELNRKTLDEGSRIIADTARVVMELEGERQGKIEGKLSVPFREIGEKIKEPIMESNDVHQLILDIFKRRGIRAQELPGGAIRALGPPGTEGPEFIDDEQGGLTPIDTGQGELKFNDLTRVRDDLYKTARAWETKDRNVAGGLTEAADRITERQEGAADQYGLGEKYRKAKLDYSQHFRGLGEKLMKQWLNAETKKNQDMGAKVAKLIPDDDINTKGQISRTIRQTLKAAGIDTSAFDDIVRQTRIEQQVPKRITEVAKEGKANVEAQAKQESAALKKGTQGKIGQATEEAEQQRLSLKKGTKEKISQITGDEFTEGEVERQRKIIQKEAAREPEAAKKKFADIERDVERNAIIPGYTSEELAGKSTRDLYQLKMQQMARTHQAGFAIPFVMMTYGILHASLFPFTYGLTRASIPQMLKSKGFQDWIIEQTGVSPKSPQGNRMRRAITELGPAAVRLYNTGIPQAAVRQQKRQSNEPPTRDDLEP